MKNLKSFKLHNESYMPPPPGFGSMDNSKSKKNLNFTKEDLFDAFSHYAFTTISNQPYNQKELKEEFNNWFNKKYGVTENILPKPYKKVKCLECGEEVCDNLNYKIGHLYNKHNCKPSVDDYKAKNMLKKYFA